jgi:hypothetical protein
MNLAEVLGIVAIILALLAFPAGYYYARIFAIGQLHSYLVRNITLLDPVEGAVPSQVKISFSGKTISNLRRADCVIWNNGKKPINCNEIKRGITISINQENEILDFTYKMSLKENRVCINQISTTTLACQFDYLDPRQGINLGVLYGGPLASPKIDAVLSGTQLKETIRIEEKPIIRWFQQYQLKLSIMSLIAVLTSWIFLLIEARAGYKGALLWVGILGFVVGSSVVIVVTIGNLLLSLHNTSLPPRNLISGDGMIAPSC